MVTHTHTQNRGKTDVSWQRPIYCIELELQHSTFSYVIQNGTLHVCYKVMKQEFAEMARNRMSKKQTHTERKREKEREVHCVTKIVRCMYKKNSYGKTTILIKYNTDGLT